MMDLSISYREAYIEARRCHDRDYYEAAIKRARLAVSDDIAARSGGHYRFRHANLADRSALEACFADGVRGGDKLGHVASA